MVKLTVLYNLPPDADHEAFIHWRTTEHQKDNMAVPGVIKSDFYVIREELPDNVHTECTRQVKFGFWMANISLAVFFTALVLAGVGKGLYDGASFQDMMLSIRPFLIVFTLSGISLMVGVWIVLWQGFKLIGVVQRNVA